MAALVLLCAAFPPLMGQMDCGTLPSDAWQPLTDIDWGLDPSKLPGAVEEDDRWAGAWLVGGVSLVAEQPGPGAGLECTLREGYFVIEKRGTGHYILESRNTGAAVSMFEHGEYLDFEVAGLRDDGKYVERLVSIRHLGADTAVFVDGIGGFATMSTANLLWTWGQGFYMMKLDEEGHIAEKDDAPWAGTHPFHLFRCAVAQGAYSGYVEVKPGEDVLSIEDLGDGTYLVEGVSEDDGYVAVQEVENRLEGYFAWNDPYGYFCETQCRVFRTRKGLFVVRGKARWESDRRQELYRAVYEVMAPFAE